MKLKMHFHYKLRDKIVQQSLSIPDPNKWEEEFKKFSTNAIKYIAEPDFNLKVELCSE